MDEPTEYVIQRIANCSLLSRSHRETHSPMAVCSSVCAVPNIPIILFLSSSLSLLSLSLSSLLSPLSPLGVPTDRRCGRRPPAAPPCSVVMYYLRCRPPQSPLPHENSLWVTDTGRTVGRTDGTILHDEERNYDRSGELASWRLHGKEGREEQTSDLRTK